uniref:Zinc finger LSD1-type domain-containing protein n=1 Tax=Strombidium rassoulzadegani TaxID=1082188 RepID=A0A7S3CJA3_9SPIT|mmetsp:Transcript_12910/g.21842  ORF Transcript_12910/g.21842 Transcript_12910/m.21842 type:complete len:111 (+) Transcript_12910:22-354(+)
MQGFSSETQITERDKHFLVELPSGDLQIAERIAPQKKQRVICYNCKVMLEFAQGPNLIRCSRCQCVNKLPVQMVIHPCQSCRTQIQFPKGSKKVRCGGCQHINIYENADG